MSSTIVDSERAVAKIFNSAIAAAAIGAAWEVELLDAVRDQKKIDVPKFAAEHNLDRDSVHGLAVAPAIIDVVNCNQDTVTAGSLFDEAYRTKSMFQWLMLGSGGLCSRMQHFLRNENRTGDFHQRDPAAIAYACRKMNRQFFDPVFWAVMEGMDYKFHSVVDLGCRSGERLMQILGQYQGTNAIGIDVAAPAIEFAEAEAENQGVGNRLSFAVCDAREIEYRDEFAQVDLLTCFMMGHDFWPRENCISTLRKLRKNFPKVRRFLLGDSTRGLMHSAGSKPPFNQATEDNKPIFALGLEFGHVLMNVYIPTMDEWYGVFVEAGWRCVKGHELPQFAFGVIFELEPLD